MSRRLGWSRLALRDLEEIFDFVAGHGPRAAHTAVDRVRRHARLLIRHPNAGRPGRISGTRELVLVDLPSVLPYRVRSGRVEVIRVLHGARCGPMSDGAT